MIHICSLWSLYTALFPVRGHVLVPLGFGKVHRQLLIESAQHSLLISNLPSPWNNAAHRDIITLSLENHQDGVHLHRHGVTLSLQAILVCSNLPV